MKTSTCSAFEQTGNATLFQIAASLEDAELPKIFLQSFAERVFAILRVDAAMSGKNKKSAGKVSKPAE